MQFIREHSGDHFHIEVAAYPEMHPQALSLGQDIQNMVDKFDAGADAAITQFFFNADSYFYFVEQLQKAGVFKPVIPGIMPITNSSNLIRFADACGADRFHVGCASNWLIMVMIRRALKHLATMSRSSCVSVWMEGGARGLHFYTMNQTEPTRALVQELGLAGA